MDICDALERVYIELCDHDKSVWMMRCKDNGEYFVLTDRYLVQLASEHAEIIEYQHPDVTVIDEDALSVPSMRRQ